MNPFMMTALMATYPRESHVLAPAEKARRTSGIKVRFGAFHSADSANQCKEMGELRV